MESIRYLYKVSGRNSSLDYNSMIVCAENADAAILFHPNRCYRADLENNYWYYQSEGGILLQSNQSDKIFELWVSGNITNDEYQMAEQVETSWVKINQLHELEVMCLGTAAPYLESGVIAIVKI
jgi:hypothetical protein